jgi:hypothetical protein
MERQSSNVIINNNDINRYHTTPCKGWLITLSIPPYFPVVLISFSKQVKTGYDNYGKAINSFTSA